MKKNFFYLTALISSITLCSVNLVRAESYTDWMKNLFDTSSDSPKQNSASDTSNAQQLSEQKEKTKKIMQKLDTLSSLANTTTNAVQSNMFEISFREEVLPLILGEKTAQPPATKPEAKEKEPKAAKEKQYSDKGVAGLNALIELIKSKKLYQKIISGPEFDQFNQKVESAIKILEPLENDITKLKQEIEKQKPDERNWLLRYLLPREKRTTTKQQTTTKKIKSEKEKIEPVIKQFYKVQLPAILIDLESIVTGKKATETIGKKVEIRKKQEEEARRQLQQSKTYYGKSDRTYDRDQRQPYISPWSPWWNRDDSSSRDYDSRYHQPYHRDEDEKAKSTTDDSSSTSRGPRKVWRDKEKDKRKKTDEIKKVTLVSLVEKATSLINQIGSKVKPEIEIIIDDELKDILLDQYENIQELSRTISEIEKRKQAGEAKEIPVPTVKSLSTTQSPSTTSLFSTQSQTPSKSTNRIEQQKKASQQRKSAIQHNTNVAALKVAEQSYYEAFLRNLFPFVKLSKYGYVPISENSDNGTFSLKGKDDIEILASQTTICSIYQTTLSKLPKEFKDRAENAEQTRLKPSITKFVREELQKNINTLNRVVFQHERTLLSLDRLSLKNITQSLHAILKLVIVAQSRPIPIDINPTKLNLTFPRNVSIISVLKNTEEFSCCNYSSLLQTAVNTLKTMQGYADTYRQQIQICFDILHEKRPNINIRNEEKLLEFVSSKRWEQEAGEEEEISEEESKEFEKMHEHILLDKLARNINELNQQVLLVKKIKEKTKIEWGYQSVFDTVSNGRIEIIDAIEIEGNLDDEEDYKQTFNIPRRGDIEIQTINMEKIIDQVWKNPNSWKVRKKFWQEKFNDPDIILTNHCTTEIQREEDEFNPGHTLIIQYRIKGQREEYKRELFKPSEPVILHCIPLTLRPANSLGVGGSHFFTKEELEDEDFGEFSKGEFSETLFSKEAEEEEEE